MGFDLGDCDLWIVRKIFLLVVTISVLVIISLTTSVTSLPNIRIQVNNENLQSPPYLLDALKQVEKAEQKAALAAASNQNIPNEQLASEQDATIQGAPSNSNPAVGSESEDGLVASLDNTNNKLLRAQHEKTANAGIGSSHVGTGLSAIKEETIEEMLDLEPESVLRLSPESVLGSSLTSSAPAQSSLVSLDSMMQDSRLEKDDFKQANNRHFQLDVTSSHLKKPSAASSELIEDELSGESSQRAPAVIKHQSQDTADIVGPGAKSHVSPSVASEEIASLQSSSAPQAAKLEQKIAPASPPDTWEPNQVMQGVTNASLVPATVRRNYGHQTRTRITLGGGYQRDQQPPLVNPSSSEYVDSKPEKPVAPLERPVREHQVAGSALDNSRVIEVPERIVLPVSVFTKQHDQPLKNTTAAVAPLQAVRRRDSRCPSNGVTALEHPTACDKYFLCEDGLSSEQVCPNGLMYGTRDKVRDFCVHRWQAVCGDKSVPNPISSPGCRWQNGIFNVQGSPKCTPDFYECTDGLFEVKKCTISGQVYDDKTKSCQYAEQVGCAQEALADFQCPTDDQSNTYWPFPRYFLNERALIHCVSDKPQIIRCRDHERVDPEHLFCVPIDKSAPPVNDDGSPVQVERQLRQKSKL